MWCLIKSEKNWFCIDESDGLKRTCSVPRSMVSSKVHVCFERSLGRTRGSLGERKVILHSESPCLMESMGFYKL